MSVHTLPIKLSKHAVQRLLERTDLPLEELEHILRTGKMVRKPDSKGKVGIVERTIGDSTIRIKFTIKEQTIYVITVEGGEDDE